MPSVRAVHRLLLLGTTLFLGAAAAFGQAAQPDLTGRDFTFDATTQEAVFTGDARLTYPGVVLTADEIRFNTGTRTATARGHLVLTANSRRLVADEGTYNTTTGQISARNLRVGQFPVYVTGETVEGTFDALVFTNATVFFREDAAYTPAITASRLTYTKDRIVSADGLGVGLRGRQIFSLPRFEHSLDTDFLSYVTAQVGYRGRLGVFAELGFDLPVAEGVKLGADVGLYSARGVMIGPAGSYRHNDADGTLRGFFRSGYINDSGARRTDVLGRPVPRDREFLTWEHRQTVGEHFTLDGTFNYWSDSEVLRDFRGKEFRRIQEPDSFLEAAYTTDNTSLSLFGRFHPNRYHRVQERLPEFRFDLLPSPAALGVIQRLNASAAVLESDAFGTDPALRTSRLDAYYGLARPIAPTPWFTFTPVAGARVTHYTDALGARRDYTRSLGEVGFDSRLLASRTFDYDNAIWEINGLRHLVEPRLSYRYAPEAARGRAYIPPIDRRAFSTYLQPLSIADSRFIDDLSALNTARLSLGNVLQTRDAAYGSRNLAALTFAADYALDPAPGVRSLSDVHTELALTPAPWLRFEAYHRLNPHQPSTQELNTGIVLMDQEWWSLRLSTHFLKSNYEEYLVTYRRRLNETFDVEALWRYDARNSRLNEQSYGVWHRIGQTWAAKYEVSFYDGPRRESSFSLSVEVELLKF
ncbi:LPS-assembly protein LptD [Lacunisphaera limnophila]|uniref:LPS-assembly protein LptD n=1 Tax=Lacunisphaera limnophila TaxID=1838286 RepID=A0A1D8AXU9_9BACT|nr:LPS assembly protein LptD [Lacunisphaera limnophila]AOS45701.1 LPS-assembly protein LptD [Lacunisphaera limnophila]